jgi:hypothetical protein
MYKNQKKKKIINCYTRINNNFEVFKILSKKKKKNSSTNKYLALSHFFL